MCQSPIANIDISKEYDESLGTDGGVRTNSGACTE